MVNTKGANTGETNTGETNTDQANTEEANTDRANTDRANTDRANTVETNTAETNTVEAQEDRDRQSREDLVFRALADRNRRSMLDLLRRGPMTTGDLAERFTFSRYATMKHLKVLHEAGLIVVERRGRERLNHLNPTPIQAIYRRWIEPFETAAADRLLRLRGAIEKNTKKSTKTNTATNTGANTEDDPRD